MNLSMKWLREFVDLDCSPKEYADQMTMSGSKVEGYTVEGEEITGVVVGRVLSLERHPDSDHLWVCQVDVGSEVLQIVTGAQNLKEGDLVPAALHGSTLPGGVKIKRGKLRGIESNGMLCSLSELSLTKNDFPHAIEDGIFVIDEEVRPGQDIREALGLNDVSVEFEITPNRPDCLSMIGLARETAATFQKPLKLHAPKVKGTGGSVKDYLTVCVQASDCKRYMNRVVKNIRIAPSPLWLRERLRACGLRPINNIVDITNYVMLEYGQPMHAFDYKYVKDGKINVRMAKAGETITTLDGVERALQADMLVIADSEVPMAVAGVMGGEFSGIMDDTETVVFESACFDGPSVRTTARDLGMRTDSSSRFEKGLDPAACPAALERACELVELLGAGDVVDGVIDEGYEEAPLRRIPLDVEGINRFLGIELSRQAMVEILTRLDFQVENGEVIVPSFRGDVEQKADVAEEIARFYGYDNIPSTVFKGYAAAAKTPEQAFEAKIAGTALSMGYYEIVTYSFISPKYYDKIRLAPDSVLRRSVTIRNPLGEDTSVMRTTALPSMLETLARNYNNRNLSAKLFELATVYLPTTDDQLPKEKKVLVLGAYGAGVDFFTVKGAVEALLREFHVADVNVEAVKNRPEFHPGRCAALSSGETPLGIMGEIHPQVLENYGLGVKAYVALLPLEALYGSAKAKIEFKPAPKFPAVTRDLAIVCDQATPVLTLEKAIRRAAGKLLESVTLFDVYEGEQVGQNKKSVAYSMTLRGADRTLTDTEADQTVEKILKALSQIGAQLRQ